jgi:hypothetical protein
MTRSYLVTLIPGLRQRLEEEARLQKREQAAYATLADERRKRREEANRRADEVEASLRLLVKAREAAEDKKDRRPEWEKREQREHETRTVRAGGLPHSDTTNQQVGKL